MISGPSVIKWDEFEVTIRKVEVMDCEVMCGAVTGCMDILRNRVSLVMERHDDSSVGPCRRGKACWRVRWQHSVQQNMQGQPSAGTRQVEWGLEEVMVTDASRLVYNECEKREGEYMGGV